MPAIPQALFKPARAALALLPLALLLGPPPGRTAGEPGGAEVYKAQCARCHGAAGEGTKRYRPRLEGDRSVAQLAGLIGETMPEDAPGTLSAAEARAVAAYMHGAFYSRLARERDRPARVELARLTVRQHRQALADVVGGFRSARPPAGDQRGLRGEYFRTRRLQPRDRVIDRLDTRVWFDFGAGSPLPDGASPHEFSARWTGSLLAEETGPHEFVVRTEHAARLWVNDARKPLVDAWVKSGDEGEYRATLYLVAGRAYPLRLEYSKAKQGVDDSKTRKGPPPAVRSSVRLLWKPPGRALEAVPSRHLSPAGAPEVYVCSTPFPPDDRSYGWERGTAVSKEWDRATTDAALDAAAHVAARFDELAGVRGSDAADRKKKAREFCRRFAERAFRKPLTEEQKAEVDAQLAKGGDVETGVKRAVLLALKSPRFLYREVGGGPEGYDVAARLSFGLWDSPPDAPLLEAASAGRLATREQVARQAERMLADPRGRLKLRRFLLTWLHADRGHDLGQEAKRFPGFDAQVISDLRASLEMTLDDVVWSDGSDFRRLLLSEELFLNGRLAKFYGAELPPDAGFQKVKVGAGRRAGVLTHPYLMASFSQGGESSPIHRGVFLARGVLGVSLRPPPEAVAPLAPSLHPALTTRQRVELQTGPPSCMSCHGVINPLGFTLEAFDAVGRLRERDNGKPVDPAGGYGTRDGKAVKLNGARELAAFLAGSPEAHAAFVEQMFHHLVQQPVLAYGPRTPEELSRAFAANRFHVRRLAVEVMATAALRPRRLTKQ